MTQTAAPARLPAMKVPKVMTQTAAPARLEKVSTESALRVVRVRTGVKALSIWMKLTARYRYTVLPRHSVRAWKNPTGTMLRTQKAGVMDGRGGAHAEARQKERVVEVEAGQDLLV